MVRCEERNIHRQWFSGVVVRGKGGVLRGYEQEMGSRCLKIAAVSTVLAVLSLLAGGALGIIACAFLGAIALIFGISGIGLARTAKQDEAVRQPPGRTIHQWEYSPGEWNDFLAAEWQISQTSHYRTAWIVGMVLGIPAGIFFWWLLGPAYGIPFLFLFGGFGPIFTRLHRWLTHSSKPPSTAHFTDLGWSFGGQWNKWLDKDQDPNVVDVRLLETDPSILQIRYVHSTEGRDWTPAVDWIPVPRSRRSEGQSLLDWILKRCDLEG